MVDVSWDQFIRLGSILARAYILSILDIVWDVDVKVKVWSVGEVWRQRSLTPSTCLQDQRASTAFSLSGLVGALSIVSSVMLKSPTMRSGFGSRRSVHLFSSSDQKSGCLVRSLGAYTFIMLMVMFLCHLKESKITLPGIMTWKAMSSALRSSLLTAKATPAEPVGFIGLGELKIVSFLLNKVDTWSAKGSDRCISWSAIRPILMFLSSFATAVHFEIGLGPVCAEERPFIFRVASLRFALKFLFQFSSLWVVL